MFIASRPITPVKGVFPIRQIFPILQTGKATLQGLSFHLALSRSTLSHFALNIFRTLESPWTQNILELLGLSKVIYQFHLDLWPWLACWNPHDNKYIKTLIPCFCLSQKTRYFKQNNQISNTCVWSFTCPGKYTHYSLNSMESEWNHGVPLGTTRWWCQQIDSKKSQFWHHSDFDTILTPF
jgi:hypothetical protein